jgi:hypothetical protein
VAEVEKGRLCLPSPLGELQIIMATVASSIISRIWEWLVAAIEKGCALGEDLRIACNSWSNSADIGNKLKRFGV